MAVSRKHKHRAMNRPVTRRYMEKQLAALRADLTSTIVHATAHEGIEDSGLPSITARPSRARLNRAVGGRS